MKTYSALKAQIDKLEKQAAAIRQKEVSKVVAALKKTIAEYDLSAADLGLSPGVRKMPQRKARRAGAATVGVPKYRNPQTGDTWTGRGRPPAWIAGVKDREAFRIGSNGSPKRAAKVPPKPSGRSARAARGRKKSATKATASA